MDNKKIYEKIVDSFLDNFLLPNESNITYVVTSEGKMISGVPMKTDNELIMSIVTFMIVQAPKEIDINLIREILLEKDIITKQKANNDTVFFATNKAVNFSLLVSYINNEKVINSLREFILGEHIKKYEQSLGVLNVTMQDTMTRIGDAVIMANNNAVKTSTQEITHSISALYSDITNMLKPYKEQNTDDESYSIFEEIKSLINKNDSSEESK